ncbi:carboxyl-terminal-processing peptidase 3, chloroplastic isoform X1 [Mercurialis annua]|uniref:carboxyl-terminal-processing peptidase 3, chloroplastic isoform X1 n=2 Tax=Mercurialis annua TaxID=3986 RepID=UPI00215F2AC1|nr:carboxyl-terminal-processing peptidase 3, chloroplastic isoform X1 [Mercurialis annua]
MESLCPTFELSLTSKLLFSSPPFSSQPYHKKWRAVCSASSFHRTVKTDSKPQSVAPDFIKSIGKGVIGFAAAAATALSSLPYFDSPAFAEAITVAFPVSRAREVNTVQRTLVEAWGLIRETFVDPTFNHQDWDMKLQQTMVEMFPLNSADAAYTKISGMLSTLGDPFTRIISPKEYQSFRIGSDGNLQGVGIFINVEPKTGHLVVLSCIDSSPAARAGIHQGDELIEINGERLDGFDSEAAARKLRGPAGTSVTVKVHNAKNSTSDSSIRVVNLPRENIKLSPISSTIIPHKTPDGRQTKTGYVKLSTFSQSAAVDMANTILEMETEGVHSYILDLRNNPGGLVTAGLDVAQMWLDGDETLVNTIDREGNMLPINMVNGHALTHDPLVVLINEGSASASEILAGALHDNGRAILVGRKTFGKGKIQSVTELHDGSALFVTVAKYVSPARHDIDQVGIMPDVQCTTDMLNSPREYSLLKNKSSASSLEADSCILVAEHQLDVQQSTGTAS